MSSYAPERYYEVMPQLCFLGRIKVCIHTHIEPPNTPAPHSPPNTHWRIQGGVNHIVCWAVSSETVIQEQDCQECRTGNANTPSTPPTKILASEPIR